MQIHVSRRCNLKCRHCYSLSGPEERDEVPVGLFLQAITDASREGYNVVGVSGGEPLMYRPLRKLLLHARALGMVTTVTTNGMLLDARRIGWLVGAVHLVAISLDGTPDSHNRMRGSAQAFKQMTRRLPALRASGIPFGFIFTLTQHNLHEVEWVTRFALAEGAHLLQIHPLEIVGRAARDLAHSSPDSTELNYAVLAAARAQEIAGETLRVQLDVAGRDAMREAPERVFAGEWPSADGRVSDLLSPLIIEADGTVVPVEYAFGRKYALGRLQDDRLPSLFARWRASSEASFRRLCRDVYDEATAPTQPAVVNWYRLLSTRAEGRSPQGYAAR